MADFAATIDAWCLKSQKRMEAIFRKSTERTVSLAQSRIPVDIGFARASVRASLNAMPPIDPSFTNKSRQTVAYDPGDITLTIATAQLGDVIYIGWTAAYVGFLEFGSSKQAPSGFVRISAMEWQQTVSKVVEEAKARVG